MRSHLMLALVAGLGFSAQAAADSYTFDLWAADGSRWYEYFSNAYAELGTAWNGSGTKDGFYYIHDQGGAVVPGSPVGGGADVFPYDNDFSDFGVVSWSGTTGVGLETAAITGLSNLQFKKYIADNDSLTDALGYTYSIDGFSGTVTLFNGAVTGIELASDVTFTYDTSAFGMGVMAYSGTFNISNGQFALYVDGSYPTFPGMEDARYVWDVHGTVANLAPVPEPGTYAMLLAGLGMVGFMARRRARFS